MGLLTARDAGDFVLLADTGEKFAPEMNSLLAEDVVRVEGSA